MLVTVESEVSINQYSKIINKTQLRIRKSREVK
jgi:hypothetical protein